MPQDWLAAHPAGADGLVRISMAYPDARPVFSYADSAELRKRMAFAFGNRAYPANDSVLRQLDRKSTRLNSVTNAHLVCRLLLEKKKQKHTNKTTTTNHKNITK